MKTGAVIVTWNSAGALRRCLEAARGAVERVLVVDNASADESATVARSAAGVEVIANPVNRGFAAAVNQGFAALEDCEAVLVLNPDAEVVCGVEALVEELVRRPDAGVAAGALVDEAAFRRAGFRSGGFRRRRCWRWSYWD
jgi:N-acetylglucosaminyl-diphospho-decaprenol L-rhamnosyltransferase